MTEIESFDGIDVLLKHLRKERSSMARMHAAAAICEKLNSDKNPKEYIQSLKELLAKEKSARVLIAFYALFYKIEKQVKYVDRALDHIDDADYHIRHNVINLLHVVIDEKVSQRVLARYKHRNQIEESESVKTLLEDEISYLETLSND